MAALSRKITIAEDGSTLEAKEHGTKWGMP